MSGALQPDLPFHDTKPQGAADFYFATNATFRFLLNRFGADGWRRYPGELGRGYHESVNRRWREGGRALVAGLLRRGDNLQGVHTFAREPVHRFARELIAAARELRHASPKSSVTAEG